MSGSAHNIFIHPIPQFTLPPLPRGPMYIKNPSNFYIQNIMSNALKSILNGTWIEQAPVFSRTPTHSLGYLTSSACIKRNLPATKKKKVFAIMLYAVFIQSITFFLCNLPKLSVLLWTSLLPVLKYKNSDLFPPNLHPSAVHST